MPFENGGELIDHHDDYKQTKDERFYEVNDAKDCFESGNIALAHVIGTVDETKDQEDPGVDAAKRSVEEKE